MRSRVAARGPDALATDRLAGGVAVAIAALALAPAVHAVNAAAVDAGWRGDVPQLIEQAAEAGLDHVYDGGWEHFVGGGVAAFDCNADRLPDLFVAGGENASALFVNASAPGGTLAFGRAEDPAVALSGVIGAYPLDIDGDGHRDLVVLRVGQNRILKGGPDCSFAPMNAALGIDGGRGWTTAFAATFEPDLPGPTLAFGNYVDRAAPGSPWGTCEDHELLRPRAGSGSGSTLTYDDPIALSPGHCTLSMRFTDWDRSGQDALRVTNDRHYHRDGEEQLWRLPPGGWPRLYSRAEGWAPLVIWGMGIAEADLDADGFPEYALTSMGDTKLQRLDVEEAGDEGRPVYEDIAFERGATAHRPYAGDDQRPSTGWHAGFADLNNDARLDLFIAKGNVEAMGDFAAFDPDNLLLGRADGGFVEVGEAAGLARETRGRGAAIVDLNADGQLDLVVVNRAAPVALFRNAGPLAREGAASPRLGGNWLAIELRQDGTTAAGGGAGGSANPDAIGARLSIETGNLVQSRRIAVGGGHASGSLGFVHVGLGVAERATLRVQWPDGEWSAAYRLFANRHVVITRGEADVMQWFAVAQEPINNPSPHTGSEPMYLGIDLGTSSVKIVLIDDAQSVIASQSAPLEVTRPHAGWAEQSPDSWVEASEQVLGKLASTHAKAMAAVRGIGLSGHMHGATLVDAADAVIRPCMLWNDTRAHDEAARLDTPRSRELTGNILFPGFTAPKVVWLAEHEPEAFARIDAVLLPKDHLRLWLTGERVSEMSDASGTGWLDVGQRDWSTELVAASGLSMGQMPRLVEGSEVSGTLRDALAERFGLPKGVVVAGGGGDNAASACGMGTVAPGNAFVSLGTSGVLFAANAGFRPNAGSAVHAFCHALPGTWHQMGVILAATDSLNWLSGVTGRTAAELAELAGDGELAAAPETFLPYLGGERTPINDAAARGVFTGLSHASDTGALAAAVMQGVTCAFADSQAALASAGTTLTRAYAIGGGSRSDRWLEMLATTLDLPLDIAADGDFGAGLGAARLGLIAATGADPANVCKPPPVLRTVEPVAPQREAFAEAYGRYREVRERLLG